MNPATALRIAGIFGFLAVALGAFGAHGLKDLLAQHNTTAIWEKAVLYHLAHAVALLALALASRDAAPKGPFLSFMVGIVIFSGSLYVLSVTGVRWLGAITPFGGLAFLAGWLWLAVCPALRR